MVRLGFIRDERQAPAAFWRVGFVPDPALAADAAEVVPFAATARLIQKRRKPVRTEVEYAVPPGSAALDDWIVPVAEALAALNVSAWRLDVFSLAQTLDCGFVDALTLFGDAFLPLYRREAALLIEIGELREEAAKVVFAWEERFKDAVLFDHEIDYDAHARAAAAERKARRDRIKSFFTFGRLGKTPAPE